MKHIVIILTAVFVLASASLYAQVDLGSLSSNPYLQDSTSNPFGTHGSKYSPNSINNPYGTYGSKYSNKSATNPYATDAPKLYDQNGTYKV